MRRPIRFLCLLLTVVLSFPLLTLLPVAGQVTAAAQSEADVKGLLVNIDINSVTWPYLAAVSEKGNVSEEDIYGFVDQYADTQVTDLLFNIFCQFSATPSDVLTDSIERHHEMNSSEPQAYWNHKHIAKFYEEYKIDPYEVWFRRTREQGMKAWMSLRMNDCHDPDKLDSFLHGDLFHEAIEKGWTIGSAYGYNRYCLDYSVPEIRQYMLDYTREQLLRYDVDGIELDFSREFTCFDLTDGKNHAAIMNQYLRDTLAIVKEAERKWGHDIEISIRLMRDVKQNKTFGFDVVTMNAEKLVDSVTVCPRWASNDSDIAIDEWKAAFPNLEIYGGITDLTYNKQTSYEVVASYAAQYLQQGADKVYLYNFFGNPLSPNQKLQSIYATCGSLDTLTGVSQRYIVTYQDTAPRGGKAWDPLPARASGFTTSLRTGPVDDVKTSYLILGFSAEVRASDVTVTLNGTALTDPFTTGFAGDYGSPAYACAYEIPVALLREGKQTVAISTKSTSLQVEYVELTMNVSREALGFDADGALTTQSWRAVHRWDFDGNLTDSIGGAEVIPLDRAYYVAPTYRNGSIVLDGNQAYTFKENLTFDTSRYADATGGIRIDVKGFMDFGNSPKSAHRVFGYNVTGQTTCGLNFINIDGKYGSCALALSDSGSNWDAFVVRPDESLFDKTKENLYTFIFIGNQLYYYANGVLIGETRVNAVGKVIFSDFLGCSYIGENRNYNYYGTIDYIEVSILSDGSVSEMPVPPSETTPEETKPVETKSVETKPIETTPKETEPPESTPVETTSAVTEPTETESEETSCEGSTSVSDSPSVTTEAIVTSEDLPTVDSTTNSPTSSEPSETGGEDDTTEEDGKKPLTPLVTVVAVILGGALVAFVLLHLKSSKK